MKVVTRHRRHHLRFCPATRPLKKVEVAVLLLLLRMPSAGVAVEEEVDSFILGAEEGLA